MSAIDLLVLFNYSCFYLICKILLLNSQVKKPNFKIWYSPLLDDDKREFIDDGEDSMVGEPKYYRLIGVEYPESN